MRKRKIFKRLETIILKTKNTIDFMAVVGVFYILLFQVRALRVLCKTVCQYVTAWYIPVELSFFKNLYLWLESIFRIIFLLAILFHVIFFKGEVKGGRGLLLVLCGLWVSPPVSG